MHPWFPSLCIFCAVPGSMLCSNCAESLPRAVVSPNVDHALLSYEGATRTVVTALKYRRRWALARPLGDAMAAIDGVASLGANLVTWAPTSLARRRQRGADQARALAIAVGARLTLPVRATLARPPGAAQTGRDVSARRQARPFAVLGGVAGRNVILVDDVVTSGATMRGARDALLGAGAAAVVTLALASTPSFVLRSRTPC